MTLCDIKIDYINSVQGDRDEYKNVNKDAFLPNRKYKCKIHKLMCIINCSQMRQKNIMAVVMLLLYLLSITQRHVYDDAL